MRVWFCLALAGCAASADRREPSGSALEGLYEVISYEVADGSCDGAALPAAIGAGWFEISSDRVGGSETLVLEPCSGAATCSGAEVVYFPDFDDFGASGEARVTSFAANSCTFEWHENTLEDDGGNTVFTNRISRVEGVDGIDLDDCFVQHDAWTGAQPCVRKEITTGAPAR